MSTGETVNTRGYETRPPREPCHTEDFGAEELPFISAIHLLHSCLLAASPYFLCRELWLAKRTGLSGISHGMQLVGEENEYQRTWEPGVPPTERMDAMDKLSCRL